MDDYISKTISAYDADPQKFIKSMVNLILWEEINILTESLPKGSLILDAGCAFGRDTKVFIDKGFRAIGVDLSEKLLEEARKTAPEAQFIKMDMRRLDFVDNHFDAIWCNAALLHLSLSDIKIALQEFHRVLKPKGKLFVSFKKGEGSKEVLETFSSNNLRFYTFLTKGKLENILTESRFYPLKSYYINEREKFGQNTRDLDWLYSFSTT